MYIAGISMITAVGGDTALTVAAINAGLSGIQESKYFNKDFNPIKMGNVPDGAIQKISKDILDIFQSLSSREKRMLSLCEGALSDDLISLIGDEPIAVFLAAPENIFPSCVNGVSQEFLPALAQLLPINIDSDICRKFCMGRAGLGHAIDHAFKYMHSTGTTKALICAVDTYQDHTLLGLLDSQDRLLASGVKDGFAPGEAAVYILLTIESVCCMNSETIINLFPPGLSIEPGHIYSSAPYLGEGLNSAFSLSIGNNNSQKVQSVFSSMNGESFWTKEVGVAMTRNNEVMNDDVSLEHPADCIGDVGAACSGVAMGILTTVSEGNYIVYGASDGQWRSSMLVEVRKGNNNVSIR